MPNKHFAVKIYTNALQYDFSSPWAPPSVTACTGSGFVVDGRKIMTNAHVAGGAAFLEVQVANDATKYPARIKAIGHDCDLAILEVDSDEFWEKTKAVALGENPTLTQKVSVHGFPIGGEGYCVTEGIVSRNENSTYAHGQHQLLCTQVSAAINPGNSGGVAMSKGKAVGVVHQSIPGKQNISYIIPASVVDHFIRQVQTNNFGFPSLGLEIQKMENAHLRAHYKMKAHDTGILVLDLPELSDGKGHLEPQDILMAIDDYDIANDGTVNVGDLKHVDYNFLINNHLVGDELKLKILRQGKIIYEIVKLTKPFDATHAIIPESYGVAPSYYVIPGGIVVQPVSKNYVRDTAHNVSNKAKENAQDQLIAVSKVLKSSHTQGYEGLAHQLIDKINDRKINNMLDVIQAIEENRNMTHLIELQSGKKMVIPNLPSYLAQEVLVAYRVPKAFSDDLAAAVQSSRMKAIAPILKPVARSSVAASTPATKGGSPALLTRAFDQVVQQSREQRASKLQFLLTYDKNTGTWKHGRSDRKAPSF